MEVDHCAYRPVSGKVQLIPVFDINRFLTHLLSTLFNPFMLINSKISKGSLQKNLNAKSRSLKNSLNDMISDFGIRTDSMVDLYQLQKDLEDIWKNLKIPNHLKTDMAIKYSSVAGGVSLEQSIELWKLATKLIIEREMVLEKLERFEREASDPQ